MTAASSKTRAAAVVLASLPLPDAARIMAQLSMRQLKTVGRHIAQIGRSPGSQRVKALVEFMLAAQPTRDAQGLEFLSDIDADVLATALADERPQTAALVVSHLSRVQAVQVLLRLGDDHRQAVVRRIATLGTTSPEVIADVAAELRQRLPISLRESSDDFRRGSFQRTDAPDKFAHKPHHDRAEQLRLLNSARVVM